MPDKRLIDANALYDTICKYSELKDRNWPTWIENLINAAPTIDAVEVVHARWTECIEIFTENEGPVEAIGCSVCGISQRKFRRTPYCPNCGAKMDAKEG